MSFEKVRRWLEENVEQMVELQAELTRRPGLSPVNGGQGEWERARFLEDYLQRCGFPPAVHYDAPDESVPEGIRPNFSVTLPGRFKGPRLCIMSHLDVVPPGERQPEGTWKSWDSDPFRMRRDGDRIFGRGVQDNQQAIVSSIFAARAYMELGIEPGLRIMLLFVADEETGSDYGLKYVLSEHPDICAPEDLIVVPDGGNEDGSMVEIAEKSLLWLHFYVEGKQSHGSMPHVGVNAFRAAARLICRLDEGLRERFDRNDPLYDPPCSTFEPTLHDANVPNVNTIPGEEHFCFDCRIMPEFDIDELLDYVRSECLRVDEELGTTIRVEIQTRVNAPAPTPADSPVVVALMRAIGEVYGVKATPMGLGGGTVAAFFRQQGYPAAVWSRVNMTAHQANECCLVSSMVGDACVFARMAQGPGEAAAGNGV